MIVRKYKHEDNEKILYLYNEAFDKNYTEIKLSPLPYSNIFVLEIEDKIIGMVCIDILNDIFKGIYYGYLNNICILKKYQNMGYATYLLNYAEKFAKDNGCAYIMLTSNDNRIFAHKMYLKNNYKIIDTNLFRKNL